MNTLNDIVDPIIYENVRAALCVRFSTRLAGVSLIRVNLSQNGRVRLYDGKIYLRSAFTHQSRNQNRNRGYIATLQWRKEYDWVGRMIAGVMLSNGIRNIMVKL